MSTESLTFRADHQHAVCAASMCAVLPCRPAFEQAKAQQNYEHMVAQQAGQQKGLRFAAANEFQQQVQQQRAREEEEAHKKRVRRELRKCSVQPTPNHL
jgi:hypothetical protein